MDGVAARRKWTPISTHVAETWLPVGTAFESRRASAALVRPRSDAGAARPLPRPCGPRKTDRPSANRLSPAPPSASLCVASGPIARSKDSTAELPMLPSAG